MPTLPPETPPDRLAPIHPGEVLAEEFLGPLSLSAATLARRLGVPASLVTEIVRGRRGITGDTALRLAEALGTTPDFWMNVQTTWELDVARGPSTRDSLRLTRAMPDRLVATRV
ncbi:HigA family addiction module antitoxin [Pseudoroseicyclus tamaricis]|uniref:HigA family addiction module antidote protein n=1 Tax=Pseudoroseicyclus tamaricis TaxID=2705421 RepID=A0A6B2JS33_9RHOB|nr:HigA family addiction module antitoxin [Pseudoroseicyclus tamaricis]NDV01377.1 HigA family addiction module antidote protein [Pseudoroseicyclus tamaricis]